MSVSEQFIANTQTVKAVRSNTLIKELLCWKRHAHVWMCSLDWDALPEKQRQFYTNPDDIPLHRCPDTQCFCAARPVVQAEEPLGGRAGWESHRL